MNKKIISILIFIFLAISLHAENVQFDENDYIISQSPYELNNKTYAAYKYFMDEDHLSSKNYDNIYLMIASPSTQSIGSFGGHTFIVLSNGDDLTSSTAINFYGVHETLTTLEKAIMGSTKGLPGYIDIRPFSQIAERYTIGQERTVFYYKLDINKEGIDRLISKLYEINEEILSYQFLTHNCADIALRLFEAALNRDLSNEIPALIIPAYLPVIMERNNLVTEVGTFTPPIARLDKENLVITKNEIKAKKDFYDANLNETSFNDDSPIFVPQKDAYDYGTKLDRYMTQTSLGINNTNPTLGFSFFASRRYEQRQGPTQSLQINFFEMKLLYDDSVKFDSFKVFEFSSYPKINYGFDFTKKLMIDGERDSDDILQPALKGGLGISLGNSNVLFDITADLKIPMAYLGLELSVNSELILYSKNAYIIFEGNQQLYNSSDDEELNLYTKAGITLFERLDLEGSYDWMNQNIEASVIWNYNPFYFQG
jgi:hypothetical protein